MVTQSESDNSFKTYKVLPIRPGDNGNIMLTSIKIINNNAIVVHLKK